MVIFLWGGPGQQDLWDVKPLAPAEVRGEARPIRTSVPGILLGDGLPCLARQADKFTLVRSVTHKDFEHGTAAYTALTGHPHPNPGTNTPAGPDDFPTYAAAFSRLRPSPPTCPGPWCSARSCIRAIVPRSPARMPASSAEAATPSASPTIRAIPISRRRH